MTLEEVLELDKVHMFTLWTNNKNGEKYILIHVAYDATNSRDGEPVAVYKSADQYSGIFVRDLKEFKEKFTEVTDES